MRVGISGSSGFIGSHLLSALEAEGDEVVRLVRPGGPAGPQTIRYDPDSGAIDAAALDGLDAVVHLAGVSIGSRRWSEAHKKRVLESRRKGTSLLAKALADLQRPPSVLVCASGVDYYGDGGSEVLTEDSPSGQGFLAEVCRAWEGAADPARETGIRVVNTRSAIVLSAAGGVLPRILIPFRLGLGGRLGSGRQWWAWISLDDELRAFSFLLRRDDISGPVNLAAPRPVTNAEFTRALGRALGRPTVIPVPSVALRLALTTQMADELLLSGKRVIPARLLDAGFEFVHTDIETAFRELFARRSA
jgi:uncharacterized protein (TIGR01777 family)